MTEENKLNGYSIIQNALSSPVTFYELAIKLVPGAIEVSRARIGEKNNKECGTVYNEGSVDIFIWSLGIMCQEWILENLHNKAMNGHCHRHELPCKEGSEFHKNLFKECLKNLEAIQNKWDQQI